MMSIVAARPSVPEGVSVAVFTLSVIGITLLAPEASKGLLGTVPFIFFRGSASCGNGDDAGSDSGGADDGGGSSSPFLYTWDGEEYRMENDFLLGNPSMFFFSKTAADEAHAKGDVGTDWYLLKNTINPRGDSIHFQIKEIEPEESYLNHVHFMRVVYPASGLLVVDARHNGLHVLDKESLQSNIRISTTKIVYRGEQLPSDVSDAKRLLDEQVGGTDYVLNTGESMEITSTLAGGLSKELLLLVRARYRDWTPSQLPAELMPEKRKSSNPSVRSPISVAKKWGVRLGALVFAGLVWLVNWGELTLGKISGTKQKDGHSDVNIDSLSDLFKLPVAYCDSPHTKSLLIECWNWQKEEYTLHEVIQPRAHHHATEAVQIPADWAVSNRGEVRIRIRATKTHTVNLASLFVPTGAQEYRSEKIQIKRAFHRRRNEDVAPILSDPSDTFVHTIPGDVIDVEMDAPKTQPQQSEAVAYMLVAGGYYVPLSEPQGDTSWVHELDAEAKAHLACIARATAA